MLNHFVMVPTHPVSWCTTAFILGVIAAYYHLHLLFLMVGCLCFFIVIKRLWVSIFLTISLLAGCYRYTAYVRIVDQYSRQLNQSPCDIKARIIAIDQVSFARKYKTCLTFKTITIADKKLSLVLRAYIPKRPKFKVGDFIEWPNLRFKMTKNQSYTWYLFKEGIVASTYTNNRSYKLYCRPWISFSRWFSETRERIRHSFSVKMSPQTYSLMSSLFLGTKSLGKSYGHVRNQFTWWGIVHYLARSGLHVILILYTWNLLLGFLRIPYFLKQGMLVILSIIYHLLTWPSISFERALISFLLYRLCIFQNLSVKPLHVLSLTTLIILMKNPLHLFFLEFQLSFLLTFALAWFGELQQKVRSLQ